MQGLRVEHNAAVSLACSCYNDMRLTQAGSLACVDRFVGYLEPYAESHHALDDASLVEPQPK